MKADFEDVIRRHSHPLEPIPTGVESRLTFLSGIRAVLFDIYGTLLVSGVGEVGTAVEQGESEAILATFPEMGVSNSVDPLVVLETRQEVIRAEHMRLREQECDYPEVDIVSVWRQTLIEIRGRGGDAPDPGQIDLELLALTYEVRTNPVWPMPNGDSCLRSLRDAGISLGIVSNAQFFTPLLFPVLFSADLPDLGFEEDLCFFSWNHAVAKPDRKLFDLAVDALRDRGISPRETLYIGNDMLNDIAGAVGVGFRTALFAGDQRSLRLREGDARTAGIAPDLQLTDLAQLPSCVTR